jgi:hypothetical protein
LQASWRYDYRASTTENVGDREASLIERDLAPLYEAVAREAEKG